ncbi:MAG TPA: glycosyltransferase [Vicinamibacterales bacterium]|nr:glycosyltransferase [Vicinamibacterales bacterium]
MRILHLTWALTGGGAERQLAYVSGELQRRGHDVHVGYVDNGPGAWAGDVPTAKLSPRSPRRPHDPRLITDVLRLIRARETDVIQTWVLSMDVVGGLAATIARVPWVVRESSAGQLYGHRFKSRLRLRVAGAGARSIVANSAGGRDYWSGHAPRVPSTIIRNAVPIDDVRAAGPGADAAGTPAGIHVGRLDPEKNVDMLLRASAEVMARRPFVLRLCGDGAERHRLASLASALGIAPRVEFHGYVDDVWRRVRAARVALLLSSVEGDPNAVIEAFAAGTPVILSDIGAHREIADDRQALFVPANDVNATARAIHAILDHPEAAQERAARASQSINDRSITAATTAFEEMYRTVLAGAVLTSSDRAPLRKPARPIAPAERTGPENERG